MRTVSIVCASLAVLIGCSSETPQKKENVQDVSQEILTPGMFEPNYEPSAVDATAELVTDFNPFASQVPENFRIRTEAGVPYAYVSSTTLPQNGQPNAELIKVNLNTGAQISYPIPFSVGAFGSGLDFAGDDIVGAIAFLNQNGPPTGSVVYKFDGVSFTVLVPIEALPMVGLNGLVVKNGMWYAADTTNPQGFVWAGPTTGGAAYPWYIGPETSPDPTYTPVPGGPPGAFGVNGIQKSGRLLLNSLMFTNTTTGNVGEIFIDQLGNPDHAAITYSTSNYLDDGMQDGCGALRKGTIVTTNGQHLVGYLNGWRPQDGITPINMTLSDGSLIDGPVAAQIYDGDLYVLNSGSPMIPRPNPNSPPFPGRPNLVKKNLDKLYVMMCL